MSKIDKLDLEIDEKIFKRLLGIGIVIMVCFLMIQFLSYSIPRVYIADKNTVEDTEGVIQNGINHLYRGSVRLELSGWAYKKGQSVERFESYYILKSRESGRMYILNTEVEQVPELQFVDNQYECLNCGIHSQSIILGLKNGAYDLYILYQNDDENLLVNTGVEVQI